MLQGLGSLRLHGNSSISILTGRYRTEKTFDFRILIYLISLKFYKSAVREVIKNESNIVVV